MTREAECCVQLGMLELLRRRSPDEVEPGVLETPLLWTIEGRQQILAVAMQNLKSSLIVTRGPDDAMRVLADELAIEKWVGAHVNGVLPSILTLVNEYSAKSGRTARLQFALRCFEFCSVASPKPAAGMMRPCIEDDRALLEKWIPAFSIEVNLPEPTERHRATADRLLRERRAFFWVNQVPVAMAIWTGRTPNGRRITLVYTPPQDRGHGYASNLVAELSRYILHTGSTFCFLHTDLANPTSNRIYQSVGYEPVVDSEDWVLNGIVPTPTDARSNREEVNAV